MSRGGRGWSSAETPEQREDRKRGRNDYAPEFRSVQEAHEKLRKEQSHCLRYQKTKALNEARRRAWDSGTKSVYRVRSRRQKIYERCRVAYYINVAPGNGYERSIRRHKNESVAKVLRDGRLVWL